MAQIFLKVITPFLIIFISLNAGAQISGRVIDAGNKEPIPFANAIAINVSDSSIVKASITDENGNYYLEKMNDGNYFIKIITLGYKDYYSEQIEFKKGTIMTVDCNTSVSSENLETFGVVAKVPFLEQQAGKMIVNVSEHITGVSGSMKDVMKKIPGILVVNNKISIAGNQNVTILIDGRPTQYLDMQTLMSELPAEDIDKIEVISQPDAGMEATGTGGVINIILKKNRLSGTNGALWTGYGYGELAKYSLGGSINHRKNKLNVFANGGYSYNTYVENLILERKVGNETYNQNTYQPSYPKTYRINGGFDYNLTEKQSLGLSLRHIQSYNNRTHENNTSIESLDTDTIFTLKTYNTMEKKWYYNSANFYYNIDLDTNGKKLSFTTNYGSYDNQNSSTITTNADYNVIYPSQKNAEPGATDIYAAKLDLTLPFKKKIKLTSGLKFSYANVDSDLQAYIENNGNGFINNISLSNHFIFNEQIYAAYIMQNFNSKKISFNAGLRYEHSISEGYSVTIDSTNDRTISKLFPSAGVTIPISKKLGTNFAYSYRIQRPSYNTLNPFISYLDPYTFEKGNTNLKPELTHSGKFSLTFENQPFFNLEYNKTSDVLMFVTEQDDNSGVSFATTVNLNQLEKYGASLFFPLDFIKFLEGYGGIITNYQKYDAPYLDAIYKKEKFNYTLFIEASSEITKTFKIEASAWYTSSNIEGIMESNSLYGVSFGAKKTFFENRLSVSASVDDLFYEYWTANIKYSNMDVDLESSWETRIFRINLVYRYGNRFLKKRKQQSNSAQEELNRANQKK
ncbi:MAG: TonB-dependent receptor [Flavobacteriales bacterium]|nr:TonB-dependent receptor [Flavobacteriales bacterium]